MDITIDGGVIEVDSSDDAIRSEAEVTITGGDISITTSYEGIEGTIISIGEAAIDLVSSNDGISAVSVDGHSSSVFISGGTLTIKAGGDGIEVEASVLITGGVIAVISGGGGTQTVGDDESAKAIKSDASLIIEGGTLSIDFAEDAIHSNDNVTISGGSFTLAAADDGIHADTTVTINGGNIVITNSHEGIESAEITINGGSIHLVSSDDGINVAGGVDGSGGGPGGGGTGHLYINVGYIVVDALGDGIDVNGSMTMTGGTVIVNGPTADFDGPLDYDGTFHMTGCFLVAVGSSRMAQVPSASSTQEAVSLTYSTTQSAGTMIHIEMTISLRLYQQRPISPLCCVHANWRQAQPILSTLEEVQPVPLKTVCFPTESTHPVRNWAPSHFRNITGLSSLALMDKGDIYYTQGDLGNTDGIGLRKLQFATALGASQFLTENPPTKHKCEQLQDSQSICLEVTDGASNTPNSIRHVLALSSM